MARLIKTNETYCVDTEEQALKMIQEAKDEQIGSGFTVTKSGYTMKVKKSKGEIIAVAYLVSLEKTYGSIWEE